MGFQLLGPVRFVVDGAEVDLGRRQERYVLCLLLLEPRRAVPLDRILSLLWNDQPPTGGRATLHTYVARLRRSIEPFGIALKTRGGGYAIDIDPELVDVHRFTAAVGRAERTTDPHARLAVLDDALALWRGPFMADIADRAYFEPLAVELEEQRLTAVELRAEALLDTGQAQAVVDALGPHVREHPTRERPVGLLMRGLYALGRQTDALQRYRQTRDTLVAELGIEPGPALQELHRRMLAGDAELDPASPRRSAAGPTCFLPRDVPDFTGRAADLDWLDSLAAQPGGTAIVSAVAGAAGVGKTALAVHWALSAARRYPDGQLYLNLRGHSPSPPVTPLEALGQLLRALGTPPEGVPDNVEEAAALYRGILADRRTLILLDNAYSADQVRPLLPGGRANLVLITSRNRLGGLIAREGAQRLTLGALTDSESLDLLRKIVGTHRIDSEIGAALDLVQACEHLPLALRIAAARLADEPGRGLREFTQMLRGQDRIAALEVDGDPEGAVRAVFGLSVARLDAEAARLFRRIGLLPLPEAGGYVAAMVLGASEPVASACLDRLAEASLLTLHQDADGTRYQMHDLVHAYAAQIAGDPDVAALRACYDTLIELALSADASLPSRQYPAPDRAEPAATFPATDPVRWFDSEHDLLLRAALDAAARGWDTPAWKLAAAMANYAGVQNHVNEWARVTRELLGLIADELGIAALSLGLAGVMRSRGEIMPAIPLLRRARRGFVRYGQPHRAATAATQLSMAYRVSGWARAARAAIEWAIDRLEAGPVRPQLGWAYIALGNLLLELYPDYPAAEAALDRAIAVMRATDDRGGLANALSIRGSAMQRQGNIGEAALAMYTEAADVLADSGDMIATCMNESSLARLYLRREEPQTALAHCERALELARDSHNPHGLRMALIVTGEAMLALGRPEAAREHLEDAVRLARKLGVVTGLAGALAELGKVLLALGESAQAAAAGQEAQALFGKLGRPEAKQIAQWLRGFS